MSQTMKYKWLQTLSKYREQNKHKKKKTKKTAHVCQVQWEASSLQKESAEQLNIQCFEEIIIQETQLRKAWWQVS